MIGFFSKIGSFLRDNWSSGVEILILAAILYYLYLYLYSSYLVVLI